MIEWIIFFVSSTLILLGLFIFVSVVLGLYRFDFCMNRMHAAAAGDTLGILLVLGGLMMHIGLHFSALKMLLIIIFFWFASPVSGHLITKLQLLIEEHDGGKHYTVK